jgi:hypothetical protein
MGWSDFFGGRVGECFFGLDGFGVEVSVLLQGLGGVLVGRDATFFHQIISRNFTLEARQGNEGVGIVLELRASNVLGRRYYLCSVDMIDRFRIDSLQTLATFRLSVSHLLINSIYRSA